MGSTTQKPDIPPVDSTVAAVVDMWASGSSMKGIVRQLGLSLSKVRRILVDNGLVGTDESLLYADGYTPAEIAQMMGKTKNAVQGRIPYEKGMYKRDSPTTNAMRIRACRVRAAKNIAPKK